MSVGIPTYNRVAALERAVSSVLAQDYENIDVVISDNASTDTTERFCRELASRDLRVRYVRNQTNLGPTANFNRARAECNGDYLMWLGDDDHLDPGYLRRCVEALQEDPTLALATGLVQYDDGPTALLGAQIEPDEPDPADRVLHYYREVTENGSFYGVTPRWVADETEPMKAIMGNDLYLLGSMAFLGPFKTVADVRVKRSTGGSTTSLRQVARSLGLSRFEAEFGPVAMTWFVFADVGWRNRVYRTLPSTSRLLLAGRCALVFLRRFVGPNIVVYFRSLPRRITGSRIDAAHTARGYDSVSRRERR